ncbi:outer membrane beta-barrel protein [Aquimarina aquimarini]|uniref:outer membrane beta-barrel protein n=1 Tax=Aquimarina aquimarini TaxID=1191734 RepID=UPI000D54FE12|nr:outer membrane beta-barrel protein [Aquimarina aquimarini]
MKTKSVLNFFKKNLLITILFLCHTTYALQEDTSLSVKNITSNIHLSGSIDGYYRYNFNTSNTNSIAPKTSFVNQSGFALGMANTIFAYKNKETGIIADLVFGPRGKDAVFNSEGSSQVINQLYAYWNITKSIKLTFGNFNTFLGYEVISPSENFNYSTSYMFSYGPFSHTGLKADFTINEKWSAMFSIMNPTDYTETNPFDTYIIGGQLGYNGNTYLNIRYGNEGKPKEVAPSFQVDLTSWWNLTPSFYLGINTTYLTTKLEEGKESSGFYGVALYPQLKISGNLSIGVRSEYFTVYNSGLTDAIGLNFDGDGSVLATTFTMDYSIGNLTLKPEFRLDTTSENSFIDREGEITKSISSFVIGSIYKF